MEQLIFCSFWLWVAFCINHNFQNWMFYTEIPFLVTNLILALAQNSTAEHINLRDRVKLALKTYRFWNTHSHQRLYFLLAGVLRHRIGLDISLRFTDSKQQYFALWKLFTVRLFFNKWVFACWTVKNWWRKLFLFSSSKLIKSWSIIWG